MKKIPCLVLLIIITGMMMIQAGYSQQVNKMEYFIDTDPGFGNGTNVAVTASANISDLAVGVNISSVNNGFHTVFIRSRDNNGSWSITNHYLFLKQSVSATQVSKMEYFIDTDPGFGNGTDIPVTASANISDLAVGINISSASNGFHNLFIRSKDDNGSWSITNHYLFLKQTVSATQVNKVEYFVDTDPGFGNGTDVSVTPSGNVSDVLVPVDMSSLSNGFHNVYFRSKDNNGSWSLTNHWLFFKDMAQNNLQSGEYFFDTDPGFGNGTAIPFGGGLGTNISDFAFGANINSLSNAPHYLFIRTKETNGKWSLTNVITFIKNVPLPITLVYFNVQAEGKKAHLSWQTATEQNSDRFDIERSTNGLHFEKIGWVKAAGNSNLHIDYNYFDLSPMKGINYYRLKEVDIDNRQQLSEIRTAHFGDDIVFALYNNPTNGSDLKLAVNMLPSVLSVFDASGRKVKEMNITTSSNSLSVSGLASGTYLAVLNKDGKVIGVEKFVVNR
jgi:hypothetical protein